MRTPAIVSGSWLERKGTFWSCAILIGLLFSVTNLPWHLDNYDQAKQAFTSFEMVEQGHWFYQHTPNEKIATKPPLVGWISAGLYASTRSWEIAWRLPSLVAAFALGLFLTRAALDAYGATAGLLAMSAFGLNLLSPRLATLVRTDMPLALVVFLLGLQIWRKIRGAEPWTSKDRVIAFALLTAAMLIKGPIVYAFLLPGIALFQFSHRKRDASAWCGWWPWLVSLAVFLAWTGFGIARVPGFYEQVVLREFAGRFGETIHRPQPIYFYWPHLLHKFAPWSVLSLAFAVAFWRMNKLSLRERWQRLSPDAAWLVCWSFGGLVLMSLVPSKRVDRIFPIVPPLCLLLAAQFAAFRANRETEARRWGVIALAVASVFTLAYSGERILGAVRDGDAALSDFGRDVRQTAAARGWRYEAIGGKEEGLLLYLRRPRFLKTDEAEARWNSGELNALVVAEVDSADLLPRLPGSRLSKQVLMREGGPRRYVLLEH